MEWTITTNEPGTALNSEVTDSIVQPGTEVPGLASANAEGIYYQVNSQALALAALNATHAQMQNSMNAQSATPVDITTLYTRATAPGSSGALERVPKQRRKRTARVKFKK